MVMFRPALTALHATDRNGPLAVLQSSQMLQQPPCAMQPLAARKHQNCCWNPAYRRIKADGRRPIPKLRLA